MSKYIAKQSIGQFLPGDEIKGLDAERIQALLASGAIEEYKEPKKVKSDNSSTQLQQALSEIADLKADNQKLVEDKAKLEADISALNQQVVEDKSKADAEIADLKTKVEDLDKQLKAAKKPTTKTADDAK